jgi:hypothetical protein
MRKKYRFIHTWKCGSPLGTPDKELDIKRDMTTMKMLRKSHPRWKGFSLNSKDEPFRPFAFPEAPAVRDFSSRILPSAVFIMRV